MKKLTAVALESPIKSERVTAFNGNKNFKELTK